jgi:lysophospholipase L1-like esterase
VDFFIAILFSFMESVASHFQFTHPQEISMKQRNKFLTTFALALSLLALNPASAENRKLAVKSGEKIAFMGDSITQAGARKNGYINLVMDALNKEGLKLTHVAAGKSGNKSNDMLARLDKSVISKNPDWMTLSCGVNDVWHFTLRLGTRTFEGVSLEDYKKNIRQIIDKAEAADIKVVILTSTMIGEDPEKETNITLAPYNDFLREIAKEKKLPLADLSKDMHAELKEIPDVAGKAKMFGDPKYQRKIQNKLTSDGCHMNKLGNIMMAKGILRAFGLSEKKIDAAEKSWLGK